MRGSDFVAVIADHSEEQDKLWLPYAAEVSSRSSGMVITREPVTGDIDDQAYAFLPGYQYTAGDEVLVLPVGGGEAVVLPTARAQPTLLKPDAPALGQVYMYGRDGSNAETNATTNTATYVDALTLAWTTGGSFPLPDGTYSVMAIGGALFANSLGTAVDVRITVGSTDGTGVTVIMPTAATPAPGNRVETMETMAGIVVSGGLTIKLKYKANVSGSATCRNPILKCWATRTA